MQAELNVLDKATGKYFPVYGDPVSGGIVSQDKNGEGAVTYITNTTPVTGLTARQVVCLTDTTFATFTRTNSTGSIVGVALPAWTLLIWPVTAVTLTSGAVACYN